MGQTAIERRGPLSFQRGHGRGHLATNCWIEPEGRTTVPPSVVAVDQISGPDATSSTLRNPSPLLPTLLLGSFGLWPSWQSPLNSFRSNARPLFATRSTGSGAVPSENVISPGSPPSVSGKASCAFCSSSRTHRPRYASAICPPRLAIVLYFFVPFLELVDECAQPRPAHARRSVRCRSTSPATVPWSFSASQDSQSVIDHGLRRSGRIS